MCDWRFVDVPHKPPDHWTQRVRIERQPPQRDECLHRAVNVQAGRPVDATVQRVLVLVLLRHQGAAAGHREHGGDAGKAPEPVSHHEPTTHENPTVRPPPEGTNANDILILSSRTAPSERATMSFTATLF